MQPSCIKLTTVFNLFYRLRRLQRGPGDRFCGQVKKKNPRGFNAGGPYNAYPIVCAGQVGKKIIIKINT